MGEWVHQRNHAKLASSAYVQSASSYQYSSKPTHCGTARSHTGSATPRGWQSKPPANHGLATSAGARPAGKCLPARHAPRPCPRAARAVPGAGGFHGFAMAMYPPRAPTGNCAWRLRPAAPAVWRPCSPLAPSGPRPRRSGPAANGPKNARPPPWARWAGAQTGPRGQKAVRRAPASPRHPASNFGFSCPITPLSPATPTRQPLAHHRARRGTYAQVHRTQSLFSDPAQFS